MRSSEESTQSKLALLARLQPEGRPWPSWGFLAAASAHFPPSISWPPPVFSFILQAAISISTVLRLFDLVMPCCRLQSWTSRPWIISSTLPIVAFLSTPRSPSVIIPSPAEAFRPPNLIFTYPFYFTRRIAASRAVVICLRSPWYFALSGVAPPRPFCSERESFRSPPCPSPSTGNPLIITASVSPSSSFLSAHRPWASSLFCLIPWPVWSRPSRSSPRTTHSLRTCLPCVFGRLPRPSAIAAGPFSLPRPRCYRRRHCWSCSLPHSARISS